MNDIKKILGITHSKYEAMILDLWIEWCGFKSSNMKHAQKMLISQPLYNWFSKEVAKLEKEFLMEIEPYKNNIEPNDAAKIYSMTVRKIHNRYSKPLMKKANDKPANQKQN